MCQQYFWFWIVVLWNFLPAECLPLISDLNCFLFHFPASYCFKSMLCNNGEALWGVNSVKKNVCTLIKAAYSWNFGHRQFLLSKVHAMRGDFNLLIIFLIFFFWKNMAKKHVILCKTLFLIFGVFCCSTLAFNFLF